MLSGAKFQSAAVRRLFDTGQPAAVFYAAGANLPGWNVVADLARSGASVSVVVRETEAGQVRHLAAGLPGLAISTEVFGPGLAERLPGSKYALLIADDYDWQRDVLREWIAARNAPHTLALRDGAEEAARREAKYALLTEAGYHFAGLSGEHSLWTAARQHSGANEFQEGVLTELPAGIRDLPAIHGGTVQLDGTISASGEIVYLPARADFGVSGWAMIAANQPSVPALYARATHEETGVEEFLLLPREERPDVVHHFGADHLLLSGFRADLSPLCHRMGIHSVSLVMSDGACRYISQPLFRFAIGIQEYELKARVGLANRYIRGSGIEIGALQKPTQLNSACQVRYIDRMALDKLLEHYPEMAAIPVQAPDIVDDGQQLTHIAEDSQDFAIANHFLEHCPDPIRSVHTMLRVVKQGGILFLAVPDKRHTFDLRRPVTPYAVLKSAFVSGQRSGVADLFYEWAHLVYNQPVDKARETAKKLMEEDYSIHYNVWAAGDLLNFLLSARHDFQIPFELLAVVSSDNETIVLLERTAGRLSL